MILATAIIIIVSVVVIGACTILLPVRLLIDASVAKAKKKQAAA